MKKLILILSSAIGLIYGAFIFLSYFMASIYYGSFGIDITQWTSDWNEWISITFEGLINFFFILLTTFTVCAFIIFIEKTLYYALSENKKKRLESIIKHVGYTLVGFAPVVLVFGVYVQQGYKMDPSDLPIFLCSAIFSLALVVRKYFPRVLFISVKDIKKRWILAAIAVLLMFIQPFAYVSEQYTTLKGATANTTAFYGKERLDSLMYLGSTRGYYFLHSRKSKTSYILRRDSTKLEMTVGKNHLKMK